MTSATLLVLPLLVRLVVGTPISLRLRRIPLATTANVGRICRPAGVTPATMNVARALQLERRRLLRNLQPQRQGLSPDHDRRAVLQALQPLRLPTPSRDRCDARTALRLVACLPAGRLDLGIFDQLRASVPDHGSRQISRDVEARFGPARAAAVLPAAGAELARFSLD